MPFSVNSNIIENLFLSFPFKENHFETIYCFLRRSLPTYTHTVNIKIYINLCEANKNKEYTNNKNLWKKIRTYPTVQLHNTLCATLQRMNSFILFYSFLFCFLNGFHLLFPQYWANHIRDGKFPSTVVCVRIRMYINHHHGENKSSTPIYIHVYNTPKVFCERIYVAIAIAIHLLLPMSDL